jgi:hypothetical protein
VFGAAAKTSARTDQLSRSTARSAIDTIRTALHIRAGQRVMADVEHPGVHRAHQGSEEQEVVLDSPRGGDPAGVDLPVHGLAEVCQETADDVLGDGVVAREEHVGRRHSTVGCTPIGPPTVFSVLTIRVSGSACCNRSPRLEFG